MHQSSNPFAYRKPITLENLDDLFAHHRSSLAGWSMEADGAAGGGDGGGGDDGGGAGGDGGKGYTPPASQDDLSRLIGERVARERAKFADYDELKKKAEEHDKAAEAARTDQEKAVETARKEGETTARQQSDARIIRSEAKVALATAKARNAGAAVKLLDLNGLSVGDDGEVDPTALAAKVKALQESDPYLFDDGKGGKPKPDHSQGGGGDDSPKTVKQVMEERRTAREAKK